MISLQGCVWIIRPVENKITPNIPFKNGTWPRTPLTPLSTYAITLYDIILIEYIEILCIFIAVMFLLIIKAKKSYCNYNSRYHINYLYILLS